MLDSPFTVLVLGEFAMAKVPPGVGPRYPQVVVLIGATGDLAKRKLLPGLAHLATAGFIPGCRIIGVSLDDLDADGFRHIVRHALDEFASPKINGADRDAFAASLDYVPLQAGGDASISNSGVHGDGAADQS